MLPKMSGAWRAARLPAVLNDYSRRFEAHPSSCNVPRPTMQNRINYMCRNVSVATTRVQMFSSSAPTQAADDVDWQERSRLLVGDHGLSALAATRVLLVGLGGVGGYAAEFLVRAGLGTLTIVDGDVVDTTNRNRQLLALTSTVGTSKAAVMEQRLLDINPALNLTVRDEFLHPERAMELLDSAEFDFVLDCIDSLAPKVNLIAAAHGMGLKVVSSMGAGGRLNPAAIQVADISKTSNDRFAKAVRRSLRRKHGIRKGVATVFSSELAPKESMAQVDGVKFKRSYYGTISYIPALFGLNMAAHVINSVLQMDQMDDNEHGPGRQPAAAPPISAPAASTGRSECASKDVLAADNLDAPLLVFDRVEGVGVGYDGSCI